MRRACAIAASVVAVSAAAFFATSYATASAPQPNYVSSLPASNLPTTGLPTNAREAMNRATFMADRFGITPDSLDQARVLADTDAGTIYVVSGIKGVCLVLSGAVSCSNGLSDSDTHDSIVNALLVPMPNGHYVGGGLLASDSSDVDILTESGARIRAIKTRGGFVVRSSQGVLAGREHQIQFVVAN
jgi:hypothetical protein